jgi:hypothetical protein
MLLSGRQHWNIAKLLTQKARQATDAERRRLCQARSRTHIALAFLAWRKEYDQQTGIFSRAEPELRPL